MKSMIAIALTFFALAAWAGTRQDNSSPAQAIDGEQVYKSNCTRCHSTPPTMNTRETKVVVRHMRVRANLIAQDANAVLQYLSETARDK